MKISNNALRMMIDDCPFGVLVVNAGHRIIDVNHHGARLLEYTPVEMIGTNLSDYVGGNGHAHHTASSKFIQGDYHSMRSLKPSVTHGLTKSNRRIKLHIQIQKLDDDCAYAVFHDPIEFMPNDSLTDAMPREHLYKTLEQLEGQYSLLFVDLNKFKEINDNLGHLTGDAVLQTVAKRIRHSLRETDIFCRYGGDEFIIVIPGGKDIAEIVKAKIKKAVNESIRSREHTINISCSVGIATSDETTDIEEMIQAADIRMYKEKQNEDTFTV